MEGSIQTIMLGGTEYVIVPRAEYEQLAGSSPQEESADGERCREWPRARGRFLREGRPQSVQAA
jgi:hypothetical protein